MRNQKGFSILELLSVLLLLALIIALMAFVLLDKINEARGNTLISEARLVYTAAKAVILESQAQSGANEEIRDVDYIYGLTGTVSDVALPVQTKLSKRITTLIAPDVVLSDEPSESAARVSYDIEDGVILSMSYEAFVKSRLYTVTLSDGEEAAVVESDPAKPKRR